MILNKQNTNLDIVYYRGSARRADGAGASARQRALGVVHKHCAALRAARCHRQDRPQRGVLGRRPGVLQRHAGYTAGELSMVPLCPSS